MDNEAAFLQAALPEPAILLHQQLLPYSLGHSLVLHRFGSPFVTEDDRLPDVQDLFFAVYVCCHEYDQVQPALLLPGKEFRTLIKDWVKLCGDFDPAAVMVDFAQYLIDGSSCPTFTPIYRRGAPPPRRPGSPFTAVLLTTLTGHLHWTRSEALNCPYGMAQWLYCIYWESQRALRIHDPSELDKVRAAAAAVGLRPITFTREEIAAFRASQRN
jgi:hypothetical protein